jgi:NitT/TauT family transport system ATP-binding protein
LEQARSLLSAAGLAHVEPYHPKQLSMGMRKRVELLRALFSDDEFFVADEPFTALDVQTRGELYDVWRKLRTAHPRTGIICTHDPIEAVTLCDAIIVLRHRTSEPATIACVAIPGEARLEDRTTRTVFGEFVQTLINMME